MDPLLVPLLFIHGPHNLHINEPFYSLKYSIILAAGASYASKVACRPHIKGDLRPYLQAESLSVGGLYMTNIIWLHL